MDQSKDINFVVMRLAESSSAEFAILDWLVDL